MFSYDLLCEFALYLILLIHTFGDMKDSITQPIKHAVVGKDESENTRPEDYVHKDEEEAEEDPASPSYDMH